VVDISIVMLFLQEYLFVFRYKVLFFSAMTIIATFVHSMVIGSFYFDASTVFNTSSVVCNISQVIVNGTTENAAIVDVELGYFVSAFTFAAFAVPPLILMLFCVPGKFVLEKNI
jgi:hypothetical protein